MQTDVLIIGGGISGTAVARELCKYELDITLVEREADVGWGQTKAGYAIRHPGVRWPDGSLAQRLIVRGNQLMDRLIEDLDIEYKPLGELALAFDRKELSALERLKERGDALHIQGLEMLDAAEIRRREPNVNPSVVGALYMPTAGVFNPFDLLYAFYENARDNGVHMMMDSEVMEIAYENSEFVVRTTRGDISARYIVNAAGLFADKVADMAGSADFRITSNSKGSCIILDRRLGDVVRHIVTGVRDLQNMTRYKLVTPTFHGKILIYTSFSEPAKDLEDRAMAQRVFDVTLQHAKDLLPAVDFEKNVIAAFSSIAAKNDRGDFIIDPSPKYQKLVHVAPTPPGLTASPAIAEHAAELLQKSGLHLQRKRDYIPRRKRMTSLRQMSRHEIKERVKQDPCFGRVICRCENVTEGEIIEAIRRGAGTLDGIKFRTLASMGKCQSNYCSHALAKILAREKGRPVKEITKKGRKSCYTISGE